LSRSQREAVFAGVRLVLVVAGLVFVLSWWLMQKAPDYRADLRVRLVPDNGVTFIGSTPMGQRVREAWRLPVNKPARFRVVVPGEDPVVHFHEGFLQGLPDLSVRLVRVNGERVELSVFPGTQADWTRHSVPVPAEPLEQIELEFVALDGRGRPGLGVILLSDVVLESTGRPVDETENPVIARAVSLDLLADSAPLQERAPATEESAREFMPGPSCLPLLDGSSRTLEIARVPSGGTLHVSLHLAETEGARAVPGDRVMVYAEDLVLANIPLVSFTSSDKDGRPVTELSFSTDLKSWFGGPLSVQFELHGGEGLFVGIREALVTVPEPRTRRQFVDGQGNNVLLVIIDGLRPDRLGSHGYQRGHTPVMDRLAMRGVRYTNLVTPSSWSLPNVASLLTGVSPLVHGIGLRPGRAISPRVITLAEAASWAGYTTACFTSSADISERTGLGRGYETLVASDLPADSLVDRAIDWLPEASQYEWFLTLHLSDPTYPHTPTQLDREAVLGTLDEELVARLRVLDSRPGAAEGMALELGPLYDAELAGVDRALGKLLEALDMRGLGDSTLVVVVGSHGQEFFEHEGRAQGQTLYDEVVHVPLIAAGPGVVGMTRPPIVQNESIQMVDVTQLVGYLGRLMTSGHLPGRLPPPFGPRDNTQIVHSMLLPFQGVTRKHMESSRRDGLMLLVDRQAGTRSLYETGGEPGPDVDLLAPPAAQVWLNEAEFLEAAFDEWYRDRILSSAARAVPWQP
jgi:hypothetical protein